MNGFLKQSTASQTRTIGPFVDDTDFKTAETGLTIANTDIRVKKNGANDVDKNSGGGTHDVNGCYHLTWDATDTDTVGELHYSVKVAGALQVFGTYVVLEEAIYDALFATSANAWSGAAGSTTLTALATGSITAAVVATGAIDADAIADNAIDAGAIAADAITAAKIANGAIDAATFAADVDAEILSYIVDDATRIDASALNTATGTSIPDILTDTGTTLQAELDGIQADTEDIQTRIPAALTAGGNIKADALAISGDTTAADRLEALMDGTIVAQVNDAGATTTVFIADGFTEATNDHFNGRLITFITGALSGQQTSIADYVGATQTFTVVALTEAPADDDFFVIH